MGNILLTITALIFIVGSVVSLYMIIRVVLMLLKQKPDNTSDYPKIILEKSNKKFRKT